MQPKVLGTTLPKPGVNPVLSPPSLSAKGRSTPPGMRRGQVPVSPEPSSKKICVHTDGRENCKRLTGRLVLGNKLTLCERGGRGGMGTRNRNVEEVVKDESKPGGKGGNGEWERRFLKMKRNRREKGKTGRIK